MGEDFHYQYAEMWFKNLDKLIKYVFFQNRCGNFIITNVYYPLSDTPTPDKRMGPTLTCSTQPHRAT